LTGEHAEERKLALSKLFLSLKAFMEPESISSIYFLHKTKEKNMMEIWQCKMLFN